MLGVAAGLVGGLDHGVDVAVAGRGDGLRGGLAALAAEVGDAVLGAGGGRLAGLDPVVLMHVGHRFGLGLDRDVLPLGDERAVGVGLEAVTGRDVNDGAVAVAELPAGELLALDARVHVRGGEGAARGVPLGAGNIGVHVAAGVGDGDGLDLLEQGQLQHQRVVRAGVGEARAVKAAGRLVDKALGLERDARTGGVLGRAHQRGKRLIARIARAEVSFLHIITVGRGDEQLAARQIAERQRGVDAELRVAEAKTEARSLRQGDAFAVEPRDALVAELVGDGDVDRETERLASRDAGIVVGAGAHARGLEQQDQDEQKTQDAFPILLHFDSPQKIGTLRRMASTSYNAIISALTGKHNIRILKSGRPDFSCVFNATAS